MNISEENQRYCLQGNLKNYFEFCAAKMKAAGYRPQILGLEEVLLLKVDGYF